MTARRGLRHVSDDEPEWYAGLLGEVLAERYRIDSYLDKGGNAAIFTGTDEHLQREVAIKVLTSITANIATIRAEAQRLARIGHPGVLTVFDYGAHDWSGRPLPYLVMELLGGETLAGLRDSNDGRLSVQFAVPLIEDVLDALDHAHALKIVHRDLHPGNVMFDRLGNPKLLDFGLSKADDGLKSRTQTGLVAGIHGYVAPERFTNSLDKSLPEDPRSDLWSVGIMLYEVCTGSLPWTGTGAVLSDMAAKDPHVPFSQAVGDPELEPMDAFFDRILAKAPEGRPASAKAAREELRAALDAVRDRARAGRYDAITSLTEDERDQKRREAREAQQGDREFAGRIGAAPQFELSMAMDVDDAGERPPQTWWVNQGISYDDERRNGMLGAGTVHWTHRTMNDLRPGDHVLHYSSGKVRAISTVISAAVEVRPGRLEAKADYTDLVHPVDVNDIPMELRQKEQTGVGGPFRKDGKVHQGYLFRVGPELAATVSGQ